jgi:hypothetical protein
MYPAIIRSVVPVILLVFATPYAAAAPGNCAAMTDNGPQWFAAELDKAQATFRSGDSADAYAQLQQSAGDLPRRADVSLDARCVGPELWQRYYRLRQAITQALGKKAEQAGKLAGTNGALDRYVTGDNRDDARRVIPKLTPTPKGTAFIINRLRSEIALLEQAQATGFALLPDERAALAFWQKGLDGMINYAQAKTAEVLKAEAGLQTRAATDKELAIEQAQGDAKTMASAVFGDDSLTPVNEAQREVNRAQASLDLLKAAEEWALAVAEAATIPVKERATVRGDAMLAKANSTAYGPETRDLLYQAAEDYFTFAGNVRKLQAAERDRATNAPALQAVLDTRAAKIDQQGEKLRQSASQVNQDLEKTEAQKKSFEEEADALEAELGL